MTLTLTDGLAGVALLGQLWNIFLNLSIKNALAEMKSTIEDRAEAKYGVKLESLQTRVTVLETRRV